MKLSAQAPCSFMKLPRETTSTLIYCRLLFLWVSTSSSSSNPGFQQSSRQSLGCLFPNLHSPCQSKAPPSQDPSLYLQVVTDVRSASRGPLGLSVSPSHGHICHILLTLLISALCPIHLHPTAKLQVMVTLSVARVIPGSVSLTPLISVSPPTKRLAG